MSSIRLFILALYNSMWKKRSYTTKYAMIQTLIAQMPVRHVMCLHLAVSLNETAEMFCSVLLRAHINMHMYRHDCNICLE